MPLAENDTVSTIGEGGRKVKLYPSWILGRFMKARTAVHWALVVILLAAPWVDIAGHPAIRFDIPARRAYFFGLQLFATDGFYGLFAFGLLIFSVFLFTAVAGRVWCGWACPQTVFLESVIRPIERLVLGKPQARRRFDAAPWTAGKVARQGAVWGAFLVVAGAIATTFTAYFLGRDGVLEAQFSPTSHPAGTLTFLLITGLLFFDFAWFREQTCVVVCPYGRFQSVLMDPNSLTIGYDARRGEPRGKKSAEGVGDCVDCTLCVQVCPTGIDIRKGAQMECVNCAACIDACDSVMDKLGRPRGLIGYTSLNALEGQKTRILRPRVLAYAFALGVVVVAAALTISARQDVEVRLTRAGGEPYTTLQDGRVQNALMLRVANKSDDTRAFTVELLEPASAQLVMPISPYPVAGGAVERAPVFILQPDPRDPDGQSPFKVRVADDAGWAQVLDFQFVSPPTGAP